MSEPTVHSLDKRVTVIEAWKSAQIEGASKAEEQVMLKIGNLIDEKLNRRFGWMPRILEAVGTAVVIAFVLALAGVGQ